MIGRKTQILSISLPPSVLEEVERLAKIEKKSKSELIREALKIYKTWRLKKEWGEIRKIGEDIRKKFNLKNEDDLFELIHGD